jgi:hypothetical protein
VLDAVREKSFEGGRERSRVTKRYHQRPNLSGTVLPEQLCQVGRGFRGTVDGQASCLAYEDLTRRRDKEAVQAGIFPREDPRGPGQFMVDAISRLPLNELRHALSKVCTSKFL